MEIFSQGSIDAESIKKIQIDDDLVIYDDLNLSQKIMFLQRVNISSEPIDMSFDRLWHVSKKKNTFMI